jgi:hypothetical protein
MNTVSNVVKQIAQALAWAIFILGQLLAMTRYLSQHKRTCTQVG